MPNRHRKNTFVRRQSPPAGAAECIRTSTVTHTWCEKANDCDCTADENDWMWGWINKDCGSAIFDWWTADLVARCPYAFIDDRPATVAPAPASPRTTSTPRPAPTPAATSTPKATPKTTLKPVPAATTPVAPTRAAVVVTPTSRSAATISSERASPPGQVNASSPSESVATTDEANEQISDSLVDPQADSSSLVDSTIPTDSLLSEVSERLSQDPNETAASQSTQSPDNRNGNDGLALTEEDPDGLTEKAGQSRSGATSTNSVSSGEPLLGPLDPSSPGQVSKLNGGVIAGIIIAVLAIIAIFLAFWYRSYRRRQRAVQQTYQFSSPMPTTFDGPSGSEAWTQFGGAKGSMIPSAYEEEESEKTAPIYNMFSRRALPSSPMMSTIRRGHSLTSATPSSSRHLSGKANRSSGRGMLSNMKSKWTDAGRSPPPPCLNDNGSLASSKSYKRPTGTSFFARLLSNPIPRVPVQAVYVGPKLPHPHFNASQPASHLQSLSEEQEPQQSDKSRIASVAMSLPSEDDENAGREDLAHPPPFMLSRKTPADSVYEEYIRSHQSRPSTAWTDRSLPIDMSVCEEGDEAHDLRATSTRAPSLDLTWVTQGDSRIPVPSWAAPRKRYSMRSRKSSKSTRNRSVYRHSIMSTMSSPSIAPSRSTHTSSSRLSKSTHSSFSPIPDMPSFISIPPFRLEIGADKAKAIMQLLTNSPPAPTDPKGGSGVTYMDDSRPVSMADSNLCSPNLRDSAAS